MRILVFITFSVFLCFSARGQKVALALDKLNIIYIGLKNPVTVAVENEKNENVIIECKEVEIIQESGKYYLIPDENSPRSAIVKVGVKNKKGVKWVDSVEFRVRFLPRSFVVFGTKDASTKFVSKDEINTISFVETPMMWGEQPNYFLESFRITLISYNFIYQKNITGTRLDSITKRYLRNMNNGDAIIIDQTIGVINKHKNHASYPLHKINLDRLFFYVRDTRNFQGRFELNPIILDGQESLDPFEEEFSDLISEKLNDSISVFYLRDTGNTIINEITYKNKKEVSVKSFYSNAKPKNIKIFTSDSTAKYEEFFPNGTKYREGTILMPRLNYEYIEDYLLDSIRTSEQIKFTKFDTLLKFEDVKYCLIGNWRSFYSNTNIESEGMFVCKNGVNVKHGLWKYYNANGKLIKTILFDKGKRIKIKNH